MTDIVGASRGDFDTSTPAVVLKLDPNVLHHGGLGLIRSLGRVGVPMYAVHEDKLAPAAHSRYLRGRWFWRPPAVDPERVLEGLGALAERIGRPSVLFPTDDAGAIFLAEHGEPLRDRFLFPAVSGDLPRRVAGKYSLYELCRELEVPRAEMRLVANWEDARTFVEHVGFPLVAKLATPWRSAGANKLRSTSIIRTHKELSEVYKSSVDSEVGGLALQEFLPGGHGHDWFFHGYSDGRFRCAAAFTGVKERSYPAHAGLTSLGRCVDNPVLRALSTDLLRQLGFRGIVDLDFRYDARGGDYKLLDFNPRLGAQFRLFSDTAGFDVALAAYLDLTGQPVPVGAAPVDRRFLVENYDPIAAWGYWQRGELGLRQWVASLRAVDETAWFAREDLVPFGLMCLWMGRRAASRLINRPTSDSGAGRQPVFRAGRGVARTPGRERVPRAFGSPRWGSPRGSSAQPDDRRDRSAKTAVGEDRT